MNLFPTSDTLKGVCWIFCSHDDFSEVESLCAGFDSGLNLVVLSERTDSDRPRRNSSVCAVVDKDKAFGLARRLGVQLKDLPQTIADSMEEWNSIACPTPEHVRDCFKEITDRLSDEGCRYTIRHNP